jgi:hypothetical protein
MFYSPVKGQLFSMVTAQTLPMKKVLRPGQCGNWLPYFVNITPKAVKKNNLLKRIKNII